MYAMGMYIYIINYNYNINSLDFSRHPRMRSWQMKVRFIGFAGPKTIQKNVVILMVTGILGGG